MDIIREFAFRERNAAYGICGVHQRVLNRIRRLVNSKNKRINEINMVRTSQMNETIKYGTCQWFGSGIMGAAK